MIKLSSGLRNAMVTQYGLQAMLNYGRIYVYSGTQPNSADDAPTGTLLGFISDSGDIPQPGFITGGLIIAEGENAGSLEKSGTWVLTGVASGVIGWWRFVWNLHDSNTFSETMPRIDGAFGDSFTMADGFVSPATSTPIANFYLEFPAY